MKEDFNTTIPESWQGQRKGFRARVPRGKSMSAGAAVALFVGAVIVLCGLLAMSQGAWGTVLGVVLAIVAGIIGLILYFTPTLIAANREHRNFTGVFLLNLFLGWTLLGWVGSLIWAVVEQERRDSHASKHRA